MNSLAAIQPFMPQLRSLPLRDVGETVPTFTPQPLEGQGQSTFSDVLGRMVSEVNAKQAAATDAVSALLSGQNVPLHQAMIAMEEASVSFQLMAEVRNKLLESYQELMRMQL
jgi:flagellar hook-basal body complex protein FliE